MLISLVWMTLPVETQTTGINGLKPTCYTIRKPA
jgi:hypothetical protein